MESVLSDDGKIGLGAEGNPRLPDSLPDGLYNITFSYCCVGEKHTYPFHVSYSLLRKWRRADFFKKRPRSCGAGLMNSHFPTCGIE
jgi:hypothetical protein